jgi:hypothetical protein
VPGNDFGVHIQLAHSARDELRVLTAKIQNKNALMCHVAKSLGRDSFLKKAKVALSFRLVAEMETVFLHHDSPKPRRKAHHPRKPVSHDGSSWSGDWNSIPSFDSKMWTSPFPAESKARQLPNT